MDAVHSWRLGYDYTPKPQKAIHAALTPACVIFLTIALAHKVYGRRLQGFSFPLGCCPFRWAVPAVIIEANRVRQVVGYLQPVSLERCQPPACVSIALAHRYAVRLLVGWSCPRLCSLAVIILYYTVPSTSIDRIHKCTQYISYRIVLYP